MTPPLFDGKLGTVKSKVVPKPGIHLIRNGGELG